MDYQHCTQLLHIMNIKKLTPVTDFDECAVGNGGCEEKCNNTVGSFYCECLEGFEIASDGKTCIGKYATLVITCT